MALTCRHICESVLSSSEPFTEFDNIGANQGRTDARSNVENALVCGGAYGGMANAVANKYWWLSAKGEYLSAKFCNSVEF